MVESRFSGSSILPFNIIIAKWGETGEFAIPAHTSSKKTLRSLSGATGEFLWQPEKWRFRVGLPRKKFSGPISSHRRMLISSGASSKPFFWTRCMRPESCDLAWDFLAATCTAPPDVARKLRCRGGLPPRCVRACTTTPTLRTPSSYYCQSLPYDIQFASQCTLSR